MGVVGYKTPAWDETWILQVMPRRAHEAAVLFKARALLTTLTRKAGEGELVEAGGNKKEYDIFFLSPLQIHILPRQAPRGL